MDAEDIILFSEPTKGAVERAEDYPRWWYFHNIPVMDFDQTAEVEKVMEEYLKKYPEELVTVERFTRGREEFQTLLLTTNLRYAELTEITESLPYSEYKKLLDKSINILGGGASDFFEKLRGDTSSKKPAQKKGKAANTSTKSPDQPGI